MRECAIDLAVRERPYRVRVKAYRSRSGFIKALKRQGVEVTGSVGVVPLGKREAFILIDASDGPEAAHGTLAHEAQHVADFLDKKRGLSEIRAGLVDTIMSLAGSQLFNIRWKRISNKRTG